MSTTTLKITPADNGRPMRLAEFDRADAEEGYLYELSRGIITVVDVPNRGHLACIVAIRRQLARYDLANPGIIHTVAGGSDCKILIEGLESERHPDVSIYKTEPPKKNLWAEWIPEIVIEVVSARSRERDYNEKPTEYLAFGVQEYWIIDPAKKLMLVMKRSAGVWAETAIRPPKSYHTHLLPGFDFDCAQLFKDEDAETTPKGSKEPRARSPRPKRKTNGGGSR